MSTSGAAIPSTGRSGSSSSTSRPANTRSTRDASSARCPPSGDFSRVPGASLAVRCRRAQCSVRARKAACRQRREPFAEPGWPGRERTAARGGRAVALIDGETYAPVVRDALRALPYEWVGAIMVGGTEKLRGGEDYGVPLVEGFGDAEAVVDLSDEPVLGPAERMRWASRALAAGLPYIGADFR